MLQSISPDIDAFKNKVEFKEFLKERLGRTDQDIAVRIEQGLIPYLRLKANARPGDPVVPSPEVGTTYDVAVELGLLPAESDEVTSMTPEEYMPAYERTRSLVARMFSQDLNREVWPQPEEFHPGTNSAYKC